MKYSSFGQIKGSSLRQVQYPAAYFSRAFSPEILEKSFPGYHI